MAEVEVGRAERELWRAGCDERRRAMRGEEAREEARGPTVERRRARDLGLGKGFGGELFGEEGRRSGVSVWISTDVLSVKCSGGMPGLVGGKGSGVWEVDNSLDDASLRLHPLL